MVVVAGQHAQLGVDVGDGAPTVVVVGAGYDGKRCYYERRARTVADFRRACLLSQGVQEFPAGVLAAPAGLGADPAVCIVRGVPLTFVAAALADRHARLQ